MEKPTVRSWSKFGPVLFLAAFTAVFAAIAAYVFWGTWSPSVAPVMPDDSVWHPISYSEQLCGFFRGLASGDAFNPTSVFWRGALPQYGVQELKYVVGLFLAGLALAFFLRERGLSRLAAYGAGLLLGFCGYWMTLFSAGHGGWFLIMPYMVASFAFADRVAKRGRLADGILLGACVGWGTSYQQDLFMIFAAFLAVYCAYVCFRERKLPWKAGLVALAFFAIVGGQGIRVAFTEALVGRDKQIEESKGSALTGGKGEPGKDAPAAEKSKEDDEARWIFVTNWSMPPEDTLEFFIPRIHGDTSCPMTLQLGRAAGKDVKPYTGRLGRPLGAPAGNYRQHSLYVGWVTCLLALAAVVWGVIASVGAAKRRDTGDAGGDARAKSKDILFFAAAAVVFWLFSMGRFCEIVYRLVYHLPFGDYLRAPVKWHHLTEFCLCILAGFGIDALWGWIRDRGCGERMAFALVALLVVFGACNLARNDRLYCAPIDLGIVTGRNAAADEIVRRGKGTLCDFVGGGQGLFAWSFNARGVGVTRDPSAKDVRFAIVGNDQVKRTPQLAAWLKGSASLAGTYSLANDGIRATSPQTSNVSLYQLKGVNPPPEPERPPIRALPLVVGIVSLAGTAFALACLAMMGFEKGKDVLK